MKRIILTLSCLLCFLVLNAQTFPVETLLNNGSDNKRIKYVFLSDGYQSSELSDFINQVNAFKTYIFTQTPFKEYQNFFNFYAIKVPSAQSGCNHPGTGTAAEEALVNMPISSVNTYFNSTFDYFGIHRFVVPQNVSAIASVMANNFPNYNQVFIFANSPYYGDSGGSNSNGAATSTIHPQANQIAIHEIGHSFADLGDEYVSTNTRERPNRTMITDPTTIKWKNWLSANGIGVYQIGTSTWQRPHQNCKMQFLADPFCSVCAETFIDKIYQLVTPIYDYTPASATVTVTNSTAFSANLTTPIPNTLKSEWKLNGISIGLNVPNVTVLPAQLGAGSNTLTLFVTDETPLSRSYLPNTGYVFSQTWTLSGSPLPLDMLRFEAEKKGKDVLLNWQTANEQNTSHFDVQRSTDGKQFFTIGTVKAQNKTTVNIYDFMDKNLPSGTLYYRLEQFDNDGKTTFSPIRSIEKSDKFYYNISPNPTQDVLTIKGTADYKMDMNIEVFNSIGTLMYQKKQPNTEGVFEHQINMAEFAEGTYMVLLHLPNGFSVEKTVVKMK